MATHWKPTGRSYWYREACSFVLGNPPFIGAKHQTAEQRAQVRGIAVLGNSGGTLDYVAAWFIKAGDYVSGGNARIGFVATNSITQGEQVAQLWPVLFGRYKLEIAFAHRTFAWGSDARGKAHVHVVILGLDRREAARAEKRLFSYPDIKGEPEESHHAVVSPYLFDASGLSDPHLVVREESAPINGMRRLIIGSKPIDGGKYHIRRGRTWRVSGRGAGGRALAPTVHWGSGILAGRRTLDSGASRRAARRAGAVAAREGTDCGCPRLPRRQQERANAETCGNADALPRQCHSHRPVSGDSRSQFGAARIRAHRLVGVADDSEQPREDSGKCDDGQFRTADLGDTHGLATPYRWTT